MSQIVTLYPTGSAWITPTSPDVNQHNINSLTIAGSGATATEQSGRRLLLKFPGIDETLKYRPYSASFHIYSLATAAFVTADWNHTIRRVYYFDPDTVTYNTRPSEASGYKLTGSRSSGVWATVTKMPDVLYPDANYLSVNPYGTDYVTIYGSANASYRPYITVEFEDDDATLSVGSMTPAAEATVIASMPNTFSWTTSQSGTTISPVPVESTVLTWWPAAQPSDMHDVQITGNVKEYTFPAGTFPPGKIRWMVRITDATGHTDVSSVMSFYSTFALQYTGAARIRTGLDYNIQYQPAGENQISARVTGEEWRLVASFPEIPAAYRNKKLISVHLRAVFLNSVGYSQRYQLNGLASDVDTVSVIDANVISWTDQAAATSKGTGNVLSTQDNTELAIPDTYSLTPTVTPPALLTAKVSKDFLLSDSVILAAQSAQTLGLTGPIYLEVAVDDTTDITSQVIQQNCPTSGWVNPAIDNVFSWIFLETGSYPAAGDFSQASGALYWRVATAETWNTIQATGSTQSVTVPANTFPGGSIEWYISATDVYGGTSQTPVYTISTEDAIQTAIPLEPVNIPVAGNEAVTFRWTVTSDSGSAPTASDLQYSTDGTTWTDLTTITGSSTEYTAPPYTFTGNLIYWRVRATNRDGVVGDWSDAVSFLNIAAPAPPSVTVEAVPFAVINWQASDQMAYRITVDGTVYGPYFGSAKSFTLPDYLADGRHTAAVEIQGYYGLWSEPGSTTFTVSNNPGAAVTLSGTFGLDAALNWVTADSAQDFFVYRNSVRIGHTTGTSFEDRTTVGSAAWYVINRLADGNYTKSNVVSGTVQVESAAIAAADGGGWIELRLTENSLKQTVFSYSKTHALRHITGTALPVLELSPYEDEIVSFDAAFITAEEGRIFEDLRGRVVILKIRDESVVIGALANLQKTVNGFYRTYSFSIQKIHWEDYVDDANS